MRKEPMRVLSLFARGKEIGYAVFDQGELIRFGVCTIPGKRRGVDFSRKTEKAFLNLLFLAGPYPRVLYERHPKGQILGGLSQTLTRIVQKPTQSKYLRRSIPLCQVKEALCQNPKASHQDLRQEILQREPILTRYFENAKVHKLKYWQKAVVAIAIGMVGMNLPSHIN